MASVARAVLMRRKRQLVQSKARPCKSPAPQTRTVFRREVVLAPALWLDPDVRWLCGVHEAEGHVYLHPRALRGTALVAAAAFAVAAGRLNSRRTVRSWETKQSGREPLWRRQRPPAIALTSCLAKPSRASRRICRNRLSAKDVSEKTTREPRRNAPQTEKLGLDHPTNWIDRSSLHRSQAYAKVCGILSASVPVFIRFVPTGPRPVESQVGRRVALARRPENR